MGDQEFLGVLEALQIIRGTLGWVLEGTRATQGKGYAQGGDTRYACQISSFMQLLAIQVSLTAIALTYKTGGYGHAA